MCVWNIRLYFFHHLLSFPCETTKSKALDSLCRDLGQEYKREGKRRKMKQLENTSNGSNQSVVQSVLYKHLSLSMRNSAGETCNFRLHQLLNIYILVLNMFSNILCFQIWMKFIINLYPWRRRGWGTYFLVSCLCSNPGLFHAPKTMTFNMMSRDERERNEMREWSERKEKVLYTKLSLKIRHLRRGYHALRGEKRVHMQYLVFRAFDFLVQDSRWG